MYKRAHSPILFRSSTQKLGRVEDLSALLLVRLQMRHQLSFRVHLTLPTPDFLINIAYNSSGLAEWAPHRLPRGLRADYISRPPDKFHRRIDKP
jgi:hypothetical protein